VTVSDPPAIDAPQVVTVTVQVGFSTPLAIDQYVAPGTAADTPISPGPGASCASYLVLGCPPSLSASTQTGGQWLSVSVNAEGTLQWPWSASVHFSPTAGMTSGSYAGNVSVTNSDDNLTIPVTMQVTTEPIAVASTSQIDVRLAAGGPATTYPFLPAISFANTGLGTLTIGDVSGSGPGVSAYNYAGLAIVTVDPGSLVPGAYTGTVTVGCNGANCPLQIPVNLEVDAQGPPVITYQSVTDNATFSPSNPVAPGDVCVLKGAQLSLEPAASAANVPLPVQLGGASVLVNNVQAPLYYTSFGQIAFQMPSSTAPGPALVQVVRGQETSNTVTVNQVTPFYPAIVVITDSSYNLRDANHPSHAGDWLILWSIGLGATSPAVPDGTAAPANPPASAIAKPQVVFLGANTMEPVTPVFAGLSPGGVGLYQVNVQIPSDMPSGNVSVKLGSGAAYSNSIQIAVQ
jgi:uncharacterized protein (TIGR03437 family)